MIPFLIEVKAMFERLRSDPALQDTAYDPVFSDFNVVLDNHGTAPNVTVARATARIKFRYSRSIDPTPVQAAMREAARVNGLTLEEKHEGAPPELPLDHPLVMRACALTGQAARTAPFGTDASELQALAPCVVLGPGGIEYAHTPHECVPVAALVQAVGLFGELLSGGAGT
jgi:acetylornithine deacetylase